MGALDAQQGAYMPSIEKDIPFRTIRIAGNPLGEDGRHEVVGYLGRDKDKPVHYIELPWAVVRLLRDMPHAIN